MEVLFKTQHGSKLYGLDHSESDDDWFVVVTNLGERTGQSRKKFARQTILDSVDTTVVDLSTWLVGCEKGVPQYLEAMFSQEAEVDKISAFRLGYRVSTGVYDTYYRTMKSFALSEGYKPKRHALRLALNLQSIGKYGRFNPRLSDEDRKYISDMATKSHEDVYGLALCLAYDV